MQSAVCPSLVFACGIDTLASVRSAAAVTGLVFGGGVSESPGSAEALDFERLFSAPVPRQVLVCTSFQTLGALCDVLRSPCSETQVESVAGRTFLVAAEGVA